MSTDIKKECAEKLKTMAPNVSTKDKKDAAKKYGVHYNTIGNYLKGAVVDVEMGANLVGFFKERIAQRIRRIKKTIAA